MHSPTLLLLAVILSGLVAAVLSVFWHFNRQIPGLRCWTLSYGCGFLFSSSLLLREALPEVLSVVISQSAISAAAYLCWMGSRAYVGRPPVYHAPGAVGLVALLAAALVFTVVVPHLGARFVLTGLGAGVLFLLTARTLVTGSSAKTFPARHLFAAMAGAHGLFLLLRPVLFRLGAGQADARLVEQISQFVILEAIMALVLLGFGALVLANEFITQELRHLAEMDPLTSVFNRRAFLTLLDKAISNAQRMGTPLPVLVIDLDHFKQINDTWGHQRGDDVLRHFVALAAGILRKEDVLGRLGGEEFAIFLPNASDEGARTVAERLCAVVAGQPVAAHPNPIPLTASIGFTLCIPGDSPEAALHRADAAMYLAKDRGRNRVEFVAAGAP